MQATRELGRPALWSINVSRTASGGHAALATAFLALYVQFDLQPPRAATKTGDRDLKRATRAFGFVWSFYLLFWARSKSASRACSWRY